MTSASTGPGTAAPGGARRLGVSTALVDGRWCPGDVEVTDDRVTAVGLPPARGGRVAAPGYWDLQVNGFAGVDVMSADPAGLDRVSAVLPDHGVTAWLPTLITAEPAATRRALGVLGEVTRRAVVPAGRARLLGVHLEGPFLSAHRLGTHPPQHRTDPDARLLAQWRRLAPVVAVTLAPELPGALAMVRSLAAEGVLVSVGHSDASAAEAHAAFDAGARATTHLFNAMSPLGHREPGVPGAALTRSDVTVQLIVDGHHLAPEVVRLAWSAAPGRVVLVTDATEAASLEPGEYGIAGVPVEVRDGAVRNAAGDLAGSVLTLDAAVRNAVEAGIDPAAALTAVTATPADLLGRGDEARLRPGARADVVVLEEDLTVRQTWLAGVPHEVSR